MTKRATTLYERAVKKQQKMMERATRPGCTCKLSDDEEDRQRDWPRCDVCDREMVRSGEGETNWVHCPNCHTDFVPAI